MNPTQKGGVSPLNSAIYPAETERRRPATGERLPGVSEQGHGAATPERRSCVTLNGMSGAASTRERTIAHRWCGGRSSRRSCLSKCKAPFGLRRDDLIVKDVQPEVLRRGLDTYQTWKAGREADVSAASRASIEVLTATKAAAAADLAHLDDTGRDDRGRQ
jgi:hypothetical protein